MVWQQRGGDLANIRAAQGKFFMNFNAANQVNVIKRGQKEQIITDYISSFISKYSSNCSDLTATAPTILCLARSPASPVARALAGLQEPLAGVGIGVRIIFSMMPDDCNDGSWFQSGQALPQNSQEAAPAKEPREAGDTIGFACEIRMLTRTELHDAHELLVLDDCTSWVGDCLRREPIKNDAYEYYALDCATSAQNAATSFERLWHNSAPVQISAAKVGAAQTGKNAVNVSSTDLDWSMMDDVSDEDGPLSATRH